MLNEISDSIDIQAFLKILFNTIYERKNLNEDSADYTLIGVLKLVEVFLIKFPRIIVEKERQKLISYLLTECLYKFEHGFLGDDPIYRNIKVRKAAIELCLTMLTQKFVEEEHLFLSLFYELFKEMKWRNMTRKSWFMNKLVIGSTKNKFVGLNNLSNT